jgi:adhesin/invasin
MLGTVMRILAAVMILGTFACGGGSSATSHGVSISADQTQVERGDNSFITATLTGADGPVDQWIASFSFRQNESGATMDVIDKVTDIEGQVRATYTAGQRDGTDIVEVNFNNAAVATVHIVVGGGSNVARISLSTGGYNDEGARLIVAKVFDSNGNLMPDVIVNFQADHGVFDESAPTTNENGVAEAFLTYTQSTTVRAYAGNVYASQRISGGSGGGDDPAPRTPTLTMETFGETSVRVFLRDWQGNAIADETVNFLTSQGNWGLSGPTGRTSDNGIAEKTISDLTSGQSATVYATAMGIESNRVTVTRP